MSRDRSGHSSDRSSDLHERLTRAALRPSGGAGAGRELVVAARPGALMPLGVSSTLRDAAAMALANCKRFDAVGFAAWLATRPASWRRAARLAPPNRVYRIRTAADGRDLRGDGPGPAAVVPGGQAAEGLYGVVVGYGGPADLAYCAVLVLGVAGEGAGSYQDPWTLPVDALEDITDRLEAALADGRPLP